MAINNLDRFWDSVADNYPDEISIFYSLKKGFDQSLVKKAKLHEAKRLLDAGSGKGYDLVRFAILGYDVVGIDFSNRMCHMARQNVGRLGLGESVIVRCQDLRNIQYDDNSFDVVTCFSVIDHLPDAAHRAKVIQELARISKPGAQVIVTVPNVSSVIGFIINGGTSGRSPKNVFQMSPRFYQEEEYVEIMERDRSIGRRHLKYQWEHYFTQDELSNLMRTSGLKIIKERTGILLNPYIVFDEKALNSALSTAYHAKEREKRSILSVRVSCSDTENQIKDQVGRWQALPRTVRGFRLAVIGEKEK